LLQRLRGDLNATSLDNMHMTSGWLVISQLKIMRLEDDHRQQPTAASDRRRTPVRGGHVVTVQWSLHHGTNRWSTAARW
jgi:hypothetical protein